MNRKISLLLALVMVALLACPIAAHTEAEIDTSAFVSLTYHVTGDPPVGVPAVEEKLNEILRDRINAEFTFKWILWADWSTKYHTLLASGEPIDMIHTSSTWLRMWQHAQAGAFLELDELLPVYAPQVWANTRPDEWEECKVNGSIVAIPGNHYAQYINHGFMYREDWNAAFGYEPVRDIDGWEAYCQGIVDNAGGDLIPAGCVPWNVSGGPGDLGLWDMFQSANRDYISCPVNNVPIMMKSYDEPYTLVYAFEDDLIVEFAQKAYDWAERGFWPTDVMNSSADAHEMMKAGIGGLRQHHVQTYEGMVADWTRWQYQPGFEIGMFMWSDLTGQIIMDPITHDSTSVSFFCSNPERALMLVEALREDQDLHRMLHYGIEGMHYVIDENGVREEAPDYDKATMEYFNNAWSIREDKFLLPSVNDWADRMEMRAERCDPKAKPYLYGRFIFDQDPIEAELTAVQEALSANLPAIHYGKAGDPVAAVEKMRNDLEAAGIRRLIDEMQSQFDAFKASIG